jgi:hypothetical protein
LVLGKFKAICWHLPRPSCKYQGSYPLHFETKFKKFIGLSDYLHLFSGNAKTGFKVDIKIENKPDLVADCHMLPFRDNIFDGVLADPPYSNDYAERLYKTPKLKPNKWIDEAVRVCKDGGIIGLYHIYWTKRPNLCSYLGIITIVTRVYHNARILTIFKKD